MACSHPRKIERQTQVCIKGKWVNSSRHWFCLNCGVEQISTPVYAFYEPFERRSFISRDDRTQREKDQSNEA